MTNSKDKDDKYKTFKCVDCGNEGYDFLELLETDIGQALYTIIVGHKMSPHIKKEMERAVSQKTCADCHKKRFHREMKVKIDEVMFALNHLREKVSND